MNQKAVFAIITLAFSLSSAAQAVTTSNVVVTPAPGAEDIPGYHAPVPGEAPGYHVPTPGEPPGYHVPAPGDGGGGGVYVPPGHIPTPPVEPVYEDPGVGYGGGGYDNGGGYGGGGDCSASCNSMHSAISKSCARTQEKREDTIARMDRYGARYFVSGAIAPALAEALNDYRDALQNEDAAHPALVDEDTLVRDFLAQVQKHQDSN
jgi:hypothetical protein